MTSLQFRPALSKRGLPGGAYPPTLMDHGEPEAQYTRPAISPPLTTGDAGGGHG